MIDSIINFVKKHLIIKTKEILIVFGIIVLYKATVGIFGFSVMRFLTAAIGKQYFLIGLAFAISNAIALIIDIPLGISQKYIKPRYFILLSVCLLLVSDFIFLMSVSAYWLAFLAVLSFQLSVEIFFITIVTYILRLSSAADSSQNLAQSDIADNTGDMIGIALGGMLLTLDRSLSMHNTLVILFLFIAIILLFLFIYEFADNNQQSALEKYILELKLSKKIIGTTSGIAEKLITSEPSVSESEQLNTPESAKTETGALATEAPEAKIGGKELWKQVMEAMKDTFQSLLSIVSAPMSHPFIIWVMLIVIITTFWNDAVNFFEPFLLKSIYASEESAVTANVARYMFESAMLIVALLIPTFVFEYPLSRLSDKWGKEKVIVLCTTFCGVALSLLAFIPRTYTLFIVFLAMGTAYAGIYPPMVGLINEEYAKITSKKEAQAPEVKQPEEEGGDEGISAALVSILMNFGQIASGILGGALLSLLSFKVIFFLLGIFLVMVGVGSWFFIAFIGKKKPAEENVVPAQA